VACSWQSRAAATRRTGWTDHPPCRPPATLFHRPREPPRRPTTVLTARPRGSITTPTGRRRRRRPRSSPARRPWPRPPTHRTRATSTPTRPRRRRSVAAGRRRPPAATATSRRRRRRRSARAGRRSVAAAARGRPTSGRWCRAATRFPCRRPHTTTPSERRRQLLDANDAVTLTTTAAPTEMRLRLLMVIHREPQWRSYTSGVRGVRTPCQKIHNFLACDLSVL